VSAAALAFALAAAAAHASWNVLLAREPDPEASGAVALLAAVVLFAPLAAATGGVSAAAVPYIVASAALELAYFALLAAAYRGGELSVVYPVARGSAPVLVLAAGAALLGAGASPLQVAGVVAVAIGVWAVRGGAGAARSRDVLFGLAVGACIAAYTLVDNEGLGHARPIAYLELVLAGTAPAYLAALALTGRGPAVRKALGPPTIAVGALMFGAYALTLAALRIAAAAPVAAVRESSVVLAAGLAALVLHERVGRARLGGAAVVAAGVALVALG
jgi:drug/metabolite transporter (DMT)-like permease